MANRNIGTALAALALLAALAPVATAQEDAASASPPAVEVCSVPSSDTDQINAVLRAHGVAIAEFDAFCARMKDANMGMELNGHTTTELGSTSAVAVIRLYDLDTFTRSDLVHFGYSNSAGASDEVIALTLSDALNTGIGGVARDLDDYIASTRSEVARLRALHGTGIPPHVPVAEQDCMMDYRSTPEIEAQIAEHQGLPRIEVGEAFCERLRDRGLGLLLSGDTYLIAGSSHAWFSVAFFDKATGVLGDMRSFGFSATPDADEAAQATDLWYAFEGALLAASEDYDSFVRSIDREMADNRVVYASGR